MARRGTRVAALTLLAGLGPVWAANTVWTGAPDASAAPAAREAATGHAAVAELQRLGRFESLQRSVTAARYGIRRDERADVAPGYRAGNPRQQLDVSFDGDGVHLRPVRGGHDGGTGAWETGLRFVGCGYDTLRPAGVAEARVDGTRVAYRWTAPVTEWFVNRPEGLEHGFTIATRPGGGSGNARLRLAMRVTGNLRAAVNPDGQGLALRDGSGQPALRYAGLHAFDARGRALPSRMVDRDGFVELQVADADAVYPVTVDPTFTYQIKFFAGDGLRDDKFGYAIAIYSNTVVVGAPGDDVDGQADQGSAYVFVFSDGSWHQQAKLTNLYGEAGDAFGASVDIDYDTIVVGSPEDQRPLSSSSAGSVVVFSRSGTRWNQQATLRPKDGDVLDAFGRDVAISGGTIAIGAPNHKSGRNWDQGAVYVFIGGSAFWTQQAKLVASDGRAYDVFGNAVAMGNNTIAVGAASAEIGSNNRQGAAYVFVRTNNAWSQQAKLTAGDGAAEDLFGFDLAVNGVGTRVAVGAPLADVAGKRNQGAAYVFISNGSPFWTQHAKLTAPDGAADDLFGWAVAVDGYEVVVGAPADDFLGSINQGSAYDFICNGPCSAPEKLYAPTGVAGDSFGWAVALSSGVHSRVFVGMLGDDAPMTVNTGSVGVFVR
jgi:hypothetical protein